MYHRNKWQCTMYKTKQTKKKIGNNDFRSIFNQQCNIIANACLGGVFFCKKMVHCKVNPFTMDKKLFLAFDSLQTWILQFVCKINRLPTYIHCSPLTIFASSKVHTETINYLYQQTMFLQTFSSSQYALWAKILKHACLGIVDFFQRSYA